MIRKMSVKMFYALLAFWEMMTGNFLKPVESAYMMTDSKYDVFPEPRACKIM